MDEKKLKEELPDDFDPLELSAENEYDILDELTPEQLARLQESLKQAAAGNAIPHDMAMQLMQALVQRGSR